MGASVSSNVSNVIIKAVVKVSSKLIQETNISYDSSQVIYIRDTKGDVIIRGNVMIQHAYINMQALFNAMSTASAQQNLAIELAQSAKSLTSGLNLGQFSEANNDLEVLIQTSIDITTTISQSCADLIKQDQQIVIEHTIGSVIIENNLFEQVANIFSSCLETSISNSEALQSIILKLTQDASATSQGISEWAIIALIAALIGIPTAGFVFVGKDILTYLFPLMAVAGVIMVIIYYVRRKQIIPVKAYSTFIENTPECLANPNHPPTETSYESVAAAGNFCNRSSSCAAFDWKGLEIAPTGTYTLVKPPQTKFYASVDPNCRTSIQSDNVNMLRTPVMYSGPGHPPQSLPSVIRGDVWIDTATSNWYQLTTTWVASEPIVTVKFSKLTVQSTVPTTNQPGVDGEIVVVYSQIDPSVFGRYSHKSDGTWNFVGNSTGPGLYAYSPPITNASGVKESGGTDWLWYAGGAFAIMGILGTVVTLAFNNKKSKEVPPPK